MSKRPQLADKALSHLSPKNRETLDTVLELAVMLSSFVREKKGAKYPLIFVLDPGLDYYGKAVHLLLTGELSSTLKVITAAHMVEQQFLVLAMDADNIPEDSLVPPTDPSVTFTLGLKPGTSAILFRNMDSDDPEDTIMQSFYDVTHEGRAAHAAYIASMN